MAIKLSLNNTASAVKQNNLSNSKGKIKLSLGATKTNAGGLSGGLKFIGTNIAAGAFGVLEGAYDFTVGGIADLFGADEYAKKLHENDISGRWMQQATEKFNPSKGWEFAGQVASGIGQSAVGIGAAVLTGGSSLAAGASIGLGAAGKSLTGAYQQTGELGAKEYVYGAATGLLEASLETFTGAAGKIGKRIASPTAKAIAKSTVRQGIVKTMISEGIGEFFEEAIAEYVDPYLLRATKVDPNAENATLQEIAYAGLVGFFSGAILSGTTSTASNVSNVRRGNKVVADGKTNTLLAKATELKEYTDTAIAESADSNIVAQPLKQLTASVNAYDKLKNKDSLKGKMLLGEIQQGVAYVESAQGVQTSLANVKANAEALAQTEYFKNTYKDYTAADIKANKDGIATKLAISDFAGKMLMPTEQYTAQMQAGQMAQGETQYNTWRENIDDKTAESVSKQLGIDIKTASYYEATKAVENYNKSGKNIPTLPDKISLKVGDSAIYRLSDGRTIGIKRNKKGYYVAVNDADGNGISKNNKAIPESDIDDFIATLTAPQAEQSEQKALSDTNAENTTEAETTIVEPQTEIVQPLKKAQTAAATVTARKYVKNFDLLDTATRGRIVEAVISGTQYEVNSTTLNAVANLLSVRKGLNISFSNIDANGLYTTVKKERFAVINPKLSDNMLRETILHELTHDLENTQGYTALQSMAVELIDTAEKQRITEQYTKYYEDNDLVKSASLIDEEITAHFFSQFMGQSDFISKYANEQLSTFQKAKKWISNLAERLKNINNQAYRAAKQLENLYEDVVTTKAESKDGESRYSLSQKQAKKIRERNKTVDLDDLADLAQEIVEVGGEITQDGKVVVYHATTKENAKIIKETNKMYGKEDNLFFSTKKDGQILGYGEETVQLEIPLEKLAIDDIFNNEAHLTMKVKPYTLTNVKFSLTDSNGKALTTAQRKFFKDSKVVDEQGRLLEVYHGTKSTIEFTKFEYNKNKQTGTDYGEAYYFTNDKEKALGYSYDITKDERIKKYENERQQLLSKFLQTKNVDDKKAFIEKGKEFFQIINGGGNTGGKVLPVYLNIKNPLIYDAKGKYYYEIYDELFLKAKASKNDGLIVKNVIDNPRGEARPIDVYIAFSPNQIKLTTNLNPTANEDIRYSLTRDSVLTKMPTETTPTRKEKMFEGWTNLQIAFVNEQAGVEKALKALGVKNGEALTNFVRSANKAGEEMLAGNQYSAKGKYQGEGLSKIFAPVIAKGEEYEKSFYDYLANYHNIDRLKQNKPVNSATAEQSNEIIESYDQTNPEFKAIAEKLWQYNRNLLQYRVDTGLITKELANSLNEMYPHYIPTFRNRDSQIGTGSLKGKFNVSVKSTIKKAEGGTSEILPIGIMIARQTLETIKAGRVNTLAKTLNDAAATSNYNGVEVMNKQALTIENTEDADYAENKPNANKNEITFFDNGERVTMRVSKEIFAGFNAFSSTPTVDNIAFKALRKLNTTFKRLVTSLNPAFLVRNSVRDLQDAGIYTKYGTAFMGNYKEAINQIKTDGEYWKLYRAMGGFTSSVFDFEKGFVGAQNRFGLTKAEGNILSKGLTALENANAFVEQLPRLAEFMSSLQAGNSVEQALLDSADVTVNFGRTGSVTKKLNSTLMPFLNPAIQGFDKIIRTLTGARTKKAITSLIVKAAIIGVLPQLLNQLMYDDDEDYALLRDTDKENNYLFKIGNTFIKIPKGRVVSVFSGLVNRTAQMAKGEKDVWEGYGKNVLSQITPVDNMSRTILSPFADVKNNLTWYGTAIEGREFEAVEPKNRYDERTSSIAIALGKVLNYSPKKINYLLDQYSGVIGDFILPATTSTAEKDFLSGNFTIDPVNSNRLSTKFYKLYDETNYAKSNGDTTAVYKMRYLNKIKSAVSELYNEKSAIQASDLSDKEKTAETKTIQALINEAYKTALADIELMTNAIKATEGIDDNLRYTEATRLMYGAERALREYDSSVYAKAQSMSVAGIDYDTYYSYYFGIKTLSSETDANGNAITGSKKTKVLKQIASLKIPTVQKYILVLNSGYVISDGDIKNVSKKQAYTAVAQYIAKLQATKAEKIELAEQLGLTVKNNKIIV